MASRFRFRTRATALVRNLYATLEAAAIAAARRNNAALWYIPDSLTGVYQDSAGTTLPALNAPLGALLDRSFGVETLGPELVTNGDFAANTDGWSAQGAAAVSWSAGEMLLTAGSAGAQRFSQPIATAPGATYRIQAVARLGSASSSILQVANNAGLNGSFASQSLVNTGAHAFTFVAQANTTFVGGGCPNVTAIGQTLFFKNFSVREVIPVENLGPELVTEAQLSTSAGWNTNLGTLTINAGLMTLTSTGAGTAVAGAQVAGAVAGKTYRVTCDLRSPSGTAVSAHVLDNPASNTIVKSPSVTATVFTPISFNATAIDGTLYFGFRIDSAASAGVLAEARNFSVEEVLGYHATQATAANKPVVVRVPRKLGPELGDVARSVSLAAFGAVTVVSNLEVGKSYRLRMSAAAGATGEVRAIYNGSGWDATKVSGSTVFSGTLTATTASVGLQGTSSGATGTYGVSVREVLDWSYAIQFDTSNDTLASNLPSAGAPGVIAFHNAGETAGYASASASGFTIGYPQLDGRAVSVIVASPTAIAEGPDLAAIRRFANHQRGLAL